jgi:hypothetical protein
MLSSAEFGRLGFYRRSTARGGVVPRGSPPRSIGVFYGVDRRSEWAGSIWI